MTVGGVGFIPERLLMMMMMIYIYHHHHRHHYVSSIYIYVIVLMRPAPLTHRQPPYTPLTSPSALLCCSDDLGRGHPKPLNVENP